jgi:uncharacterized membrane protein
MQCRRYREYGSNQCSGRSSLTNVSPTIHRNRHLWSEGVGRFRFLDLYRGIIVLFMLEGHIVRELLKADLKATYFYTLHEIFHGVTAPGFLFGAGFTFAIAAQRRWTESSTFSYKFFRRIWRAVLLIIIGYALHIPFLSLQKIYSHASSTQWNAFLLFDVLQCIGIGLLLLRILLVIARQEKVFLGIITALLFIIIYVTPLAWTVHIQKTLPLLLSSAFNGMTGSPFPLFPFLGFIIAGTCVAWLFLRAAQDEREEVFIKQLMVIGALLIAFGLLLDALPFQSFAEYSFWTTSPNYFWIRLGILLLMLSGLWYIEDFFSTSGGSIAWMPNWMTILGVESLFVYIAHLLILFGWVTNTKFNLHWLWGGSLALPETVLVFFCLTLTMIAASFFWRYLKKQHTYLMMGIFWWMGICVAWSFFLNPY